MNPLFAQPLAIVDLETTGADPNRDRITEVAIIRVENGAVVEAWSSLVDPEIPIPARIQAFTGISDAMVAGAPNFRALADAIAERLAGALFVAHNARFDYNFLRAAFAARGTGFEPPLMCTVKLSRALYPEHPRHGLDAIIARHNYAVTDRHRAMTDAEIVWRYLQDCAQAFDAATLLRAIERASAPGTSVPVMPQGDLEALPEAPGVYVFFNGADGVVQLGRTQHLRSKVLGVFTGKKDARTARLAAQVKRVHVEQAAGELDAQIAEWRLSRRYQADKCPEQVMGWHWDRQGQDAPIVTAVDLAGTDPADWADVYGLFRGAREAENALRELVRLHNLCPQRVGLERSAGPCQAYGLRRCHGVCAGAESATMHDMRLATALAPLRPKAWPWPGAVAIAEFHEASEFGAIQIFDAWCHVGRARSEAEAYTLLEHAPARHFNLEAYRMLVRWLAQPGNPERVRVMGAAQ